MVAQNSRRDEGEGGGGEGGTSAEFGGEIRVSEGAMDRKSFEAGEGKRQTKPEKSENPQKISRRTGELNRQCLRRGRVSDQNAQPPGRMIGIFGKHRSDLLAEEFHFFPFLLGPFE